MNSLPIFFCVVALCAALHISLGSSLIAGVAFGLAAVLWETLRSCRLQGALLCGAVLLPVLMWLQILGDHAATMTAPAYVKVYSKHATTSRRHTKAVILSTVAETD